MIYSLISNNQTTLTRRLCVMSHSVCVMSHSVCVKPRIFCVLPRIFCIKPLIASVNSHIVFVKPHIVCVNLYGSSEKETKSFLSIRTATVLIVFSTMETRRRNPIQTVYLVIRKPRILQTRVDCLVCCTDGFTSAIFEITELITQSIVEKKITIFEENYEY